MYLFVDRYLLHGLCSLIYCIVLALSARFASFLVLKHSGLTLIFNNESILQCTIKGSSNMGLCEALSSSRCLTACR